MKSFSPLIDELVDALRCLPGVGNKSAQRMALHLLEKNREGGRQLSLSLQEAIDKVGRCSSCQTLCEGEKCRVCADPRRDNGQLCIVETPSDQIAIESSGGYRGRYFVLMGHLSPIDGIGPQEIGIPLLEAELELQQVSEVILATNPTVEGEATAHYIADMMRHKGVSVSRIAHGIPLGGELGYVDSGTLSHAFQGRRPFE